MDFLCKFGTSLIILNVCICCCANRDVSDPDFYYKILATKSPYLSRPNTTVHQQFFWDLSMVPRMYEPIHVDALHRHGTRFPSTEKLEVFKTTLEELQQLKISSKIDNILKLWEGYFPPHLNYTLHEKGWYEMFGLADNLFHMTGNIFKHIYQNNLTEKETSFLVLTSYKPRVLASAKAFLKRIKCHLQNKMESETMCKQFDEYDVLLENNVAVRKKANFSGFPVHVSNRLLRAFDYCEKYDYAVKQNKTADHEFARFFWSSALDGVPLAISNKRLNSKQLLALYRVCTFMVALYDETSICSLFTKEHLQALEYSADLLHYYKTGHGYEINYKLACRLLINILQRIDMAAARNTFKQSHPSVVLRFGHAETLIPLLCLIGLYKDEVPLTAANYEFLRFHRMFRTGTFSPFAGNVALVLYRSTSRARRPLKLSIVVNGHLVKLSPVQDCYFCDYNSFREKIYSVLSGYQCNAVCNHPNRHNEF